MSHPELEGYERPRRQLVLWSAALLFVTFTGVRLRTDVTSELQGAASLLRVVENPRVIPVCLALIVLYLCFRLAIQWHKIPSKIKAEAVPSADFYLAVSIAGISLAAFISVSFDFFSLRAHYFIPIATMLTSAALMALLGFIFFTALGPVRQEALIKRWTIGARQLRSSGLAGIAGPALAFAAVLILFGALESSRG